MSLNPECANKRVPEIVLQNKISVFISRSLTAELCKSQDKVAHGTKSVQGRKQGQVQTECRSGCKQTGVKGRAQTAGLEAGGNLQVIGYLRQESVQVLLAVSEREDQGHAVGVPPGRLLGDGGRRSRPTQFVICVSVNHCITAPVSAFLTQPRLHNIHICRRAPKCFRRLR